CHHAPQYSLPGGCLPLHTQLGPGDSAGPAGNIHASRTYQLLSRSSSFPTSAETRRKSAVVILKLSGVTSVKPSCSKSSASWVSDRGRRTSSTSSLVILSYAMNCHGLIRCPR